MINSGRQQGTVTADEVPAGSFAAWKDTVRAVVDVKTRLSRLLVVLQKVCPGLQENSKAASFCFREQISVVHPLNCTYFVK